MKKIQNNKIFIPCFVILINLINFIACNLLLKSRYETVDDFMIANILSKTDGTYNFYSIHIHPILSYIIMLLYKTNININCYTIVIILLQFIAFTTIGIIFLNKNIKVGTVFYTIIVVAIYTKVLSIINYTSTAAMLVISGTIATMYYIETCNKKYKTIGILLITIGAMLRMQTIVIVLPFLFYYIIYFSVKTKKYKNLKIMIPLIISILIIYISNLFIYNFNPLYNNYSKFNNVRTYLFDYNVMNYEQNKVIFDEAGWTENDYKVFYTYSFSDENFYTYNNLYNIKNHIETKKVNFNKIAYTFKLLYKITAQKRYMMLFIELIIAIITYLLISKDRFYIAGIFFIFISINYILCYTKPMYRVIIPLYAISIIMAMYTVLNYEDINKFEKKIYNKIITIISVIVIIMDLFFTYKMANVYSKESFENIKNAINYASNDKENAYIYSNVLGNISLAYSIYEKLPDNALDNIRDMGDWDIYNKEYYEFKERYKIKNIMNDLYTKENLLFISGNAYGADNQLYINHIELIQKYIKEHYDIETKYEVKKSFGSNIKIYKIYIEEK